MKTKSKHTPGPWKAIHTTHGLTVCNESNRFVALLTDSTKLEGSEDYANAILITASPDILSAAKRVIGKYDKADEDEESQEDLSTAIDMLRAAIAKAEGK